MSFLRFDRAATRYLVRPARRCLIRSPQVRIPILMYHRISAAPEPQVHPYFRTNTSTAVFEAQLRFLKANGYSSLTVDQAVVLLSRSPKTDARHVVITFDDGYQDFYTAAIPLLQKYGFTATVFLPTAYINEPRRAFKQVACLTWSEVRELHACGIVFGGHTVTHPQLTNLTRQQIREELVRSKAQIEDHLGYPVRSFSYPFRFPETNTRFISFLQDTLEVSGYSNGVSTIVGTACATDNPFFLKRLPVNSDDDASLFSWKLQGSYDWVHAAQYWFKRIKGLRSTFSLVKRESIGSPEANASW